MDAAEKLHELVKYRADPELSRAHVIARISAYVYGNVLIFATVVTLTGEDAEHWHGLLAVLGVAASTYLAHVFAELVGHGAASGKRTTREDVLGELRDATPILTTTLVPVLLLGASALHLISGSLATVLSEVWLFLRMAVLGLLVERLQSDRPSARMLFAGIGMGVAAAAISLIKVAISH